MTETRFGYMSLVSFVKLLKTLDKNRVPVSLELVREVFPGSGYAGLEGSHRTTA